METDVKPTFCDNHFSMCRNTESLCYTPEMNTVFHVNYASVTEKEKQNNNNTRTTMAMTVVVRVLVTVTAASP